MAIVAQIEEEVKTVRACCVCHEPFETEDETQVLCPDCEALGIRCGCIMPWHRCPVCRAIEALTSNDWDLTLDGAWWGDELEAVRGESL